MWVDFTRPHKGGVSLTRYALHFLVVLLAALLSTVVFSASTHAADAVWESGKIVYDERSYLRSGPVSPALSRHTGIAEGSEHFVNIDDTEIPPVHRILYFAPDTELGDATQARHAVFNVTDKGTAGESYERAGGQQDVTLDQSTFESEGEPEVTSCTVSGIGYMICPIMTLMAEGMDKLFNVFKSLLHVAPLFANTESGLYRAWSIALAIANVFFVIGFLVVIYSYVTDRGVSQYDIRTILPRVIVAAILINASYHISAIAVDISNILGANLQDLFNDIRTQLVTNDETVTDPNTWSWNSVTTYVLSGGTLAAGVAGVATLGAYGSSALYLLMPMLVAAIIAILVVIVVLAARHALITVLVVLAPIAFAAFILPSTQKYFERWRSLFMTMLLMYPMFSLLFGGSQLAAHIIAQNATGVTTLLFAMFIQVAPLVITPFLIQFSGSLLGRIAGIVNNPTKGLGDRAKNWSKGKAGLAKDRRVANKAPGSGLARKMMENQWRDENRKKEYQTTARARYNESSRARQELINQKIADDRLAKADKLNEAAYEELKRTDPQVTVRAAQLKIAEMELNVNKAKTETLLEDMQSRQGIKHHGMAGTPLGSLATHMANLSHESHAAANALQFSKERGRYEYSEDMVKGSHTDALQTAAAGIAGDKGKAQAAARAVQEMRSDFAKSSGAIKEMMDHFKVTGDETRQMANPNNTLDVVKTGSDGSKFTFKAQDVYTTDAAMEVLYESKGNYASMKEVLVRSGHSDYEDYLTTIVAGVKSGMIKKAPWLGGKNLDIITKGQINSEQDLENMVRATIADGKFKADWMATGDSVGLNDIAAIVNDNMNHSGLNSKQSAVYSKRIDSMREMAKATLANKNLEGSLTDEARTQLKMIAGDIAFKKNP